ncbi:phosphonate degradation HD-domain oxygenase [Rhodobium gokarnense]|uniref:Phosphonate degradation associated HDIG domain protein n=1 Tax=Rhodobium gokarnense TaxID=364296 RepID=A0ABT3HDY6_9HYPH|nr:phosphonate degradation HD-domain oxygenase [Rhodobium gokarnense]MCW2308549.1 phosphonate degradation associated HDIG domain protein [Rhodobium gokarnense]
MSIVEEIFANLEARASNSYGGEAVTQLQHALQCAVLAHSAGAPATLVTAALLHDYGHILTDDEDAAERGTDLQHEEIAARHLADWFPEDVTEPIRLHVTAKRYLCSVDPAYFDSLSPASVTSLSVQGGPLGTEEISDFRRNPHWQAAVKLRHWDDTGKDPKMTTPALAAFRGMVSSALREEHEDAHG